MARKPKAQDVPAKDGPFFVTYTDDRPEVGFCGVVFPRGVAVEVSEDIARRLQAHPNFEVTRGHVHPR